jgi:hypothetical protein
MSDAEIRRVREDLETIRDAAGLELPYDRADVGWLVAMGMAGAVLSLWAYFDFPGYNHFALVPVCLVCLIAVAHRVWKYRGGNVTPARRRQNTIDWTATVVIAGAVVGYLVWVKALGLPSSTGMASACFFVGVMCAVAGLSSRAARGAFGVALAMVPLGLLLPFCTGKEMSGALVGLALMVAGVATGTILALQLRVQRRSHEPASH